jgi:hypothetical protein
MVPPVIVEVPTYKKKQCGNHQPAKYRGRNIKREKNDHAHDRKKTHASLFLSQRDRQACHSLVD